MRVFNQPCFNEMFAFGESTSALHRFSGLSYNESRTLTGMGFVVFVETAHLLASSDNEQCKAVVLSGLVKLATLAKSQFFHLKDFHTGFSSHLLNSE